MAMLRVASYIVLPSALRAIASPRVFSNALKASLCIGNPRFVTSLHFSTDAKKTIDDKLAKLLKAEIKYKKMFLQRDMPAVPANFSFTIEDEPFELTITLTRDFEGEKINVEVESMHRIKDDDEDESDSTDEDDKKDDTDTNEDDDKDSDADSDSNDDDSSSTESNSSDDEEKEKEKGLELSVTIAKGNGNKMEFVVHVFPDEIEIQTMSFKEKPAESGADLPMLCFGPHPVEENSELQSALKEYLRIRGIKEANHGFLYNYMVKKYKNRPMVALKKLRKFIKE